ncbi:MAG: hypothetical protein OXH15_03480 [Gammaproteobacteria bacterium]|nr:hypothetical protein [Gammaproteobacteria bacterium]
MSMPKKSILVCVAFAWGACAEVLEAHDDGFVSAHEIAIEATPSRVFEALVDEVDRWWDPAHSYSGDAANFSLDTVCGLCESVDAGSGLVRHMRVDVWRPGKSIVLAGGLGPLQRLGVAGSMSFDLEATATGTRVTYRYTVNGRNVGPWAEPVDRVQHGQLLRLKRFVETGSAVAE